MKKIDNKTIRSLLNKYFEAETTLAEERLLRDYFANEPHSEFEKYKPLFLHFSQERDGLQLEKKDELQPAKRRADTSLFDRINKKRIKWLSVAAAASIVLFISITNREQQETLRLYIDGERVEHSQLAISIVDRHMSKLNSMMQNLNRGNERLKGLDRVGNAISSLEQLEKFLTQNEEVVRLEE